MAIALHRKALVPILALRPVRRVIPTQSLKRNHRDYFLPQKVTAGINNPRQREPVPYYCKTVFSMIKPNFGEAVYARTCWAQCREMMLLVLTHNITVLLLVKEFFYRAYLTPLISLLNPRHR